MGKHTKNRPIDIRAAVLDPDYYADVHYKLRTNRVAQAEFERAVDLMWRELNTQGRAGSLR